MIYFDAAVGAPVKYVMSDVIAQQHRQRTYYVERQTVDRKQISYELLTR